jgi:hypothetical protein
MVAGAVAACSSADSSDGLAGCNEDEGENCSTVKQPKRRASATGTNIGLPEPARPEDQIDEPSPTRTSSTDGGTTPQPGSDGGTPPPPTTTVKPPPQPNMCYAGTLNQNLPHKACYQRKSDGMWFQCNGPEQLWYRNVVNGVGPFGTCTELHPLQ